MAFGVGCPGGFHRYHYQHCYHHHHLAWRAPPQFQTIAALHKIRTVGGAGGRRLRLFHSLLLYTREAFLEWSDPNAWTVAPTGDNDGDAMPVIDDEVWELL